MSLGIGSQETQPVGPTWFSGFSDPKLGGQSCWKVLVCSSGSTGRCPSPSPRPTVTVGGFRWTIYPGCYFPWHGNAKMNHALQKSFKRWCDNNVRMGFEVLFTAHGRISFLELPGSTWTPTFECNIFRYKSISDDLHPQQISHGTSLERISWKRCHVFSISSILKLRLGHP